jgi:putative membrane protein
MHRFVVDFSISFRMHVSDSDRLSTRLQSFARRVWVCIQYSANLEYNEVLSHGDQRLAIQCLNMLAVAPKHHLRENRDWDNCMALGDLLTALPEMRQLVNHIGCHLSRKFSAVLTWNDLEQYGGRRG